MHVKIKIFSPDFTLHKILTLHVVNFVFRKIKNKFILICTLAIGHLKKTKT